MSRNVQPVLINNANEYCSRVVYIDLNGNDKQRNNIRKKLTKEMQELDWFPKPPRTTSFIFYKRDDGNVSEVEYALLKPVRLYQVEDGADGFSGLFASLPED
ncbi:hypothetical protein FO519_010041 [Halicephalobus sp. NKZ332]|nr:hypothetical protein FO519_010041 [Halicephalobus sp. NKZ332]